MARIDKTDSAIGVFRAKALADANEADYFKPLGASLDSQGRVKTTGAATSGGFVGIVMRDRTKRKAGDIQDIVTNGELVECVGLVAGTKYYLQTDGTLGAARSEIYVGTTVEADRLVVRFQSGEDA